jgi:Flp pilus assembly secretin CpaC
LPIFLIVSLDKNDIMENQRENNTNPSEINPKPTEDVQLTIETVTPDTHQSVPQTDVNTEKIEGKVEETNNNDENKEVVDSSLEQKEETVDQEISDTESNQQDDQSQEEKKNGNTRGDKDDERDKIETVSP